MSVLVTRTCANCRHQNTGFAYCKRWEWIKERYKKQHGKEMKSKCCPFWALKPEGMWANKVIVRR